MRFTWLVKLIILSLWLKQEFVEIVPRKENRNLKQEVLCSLDDQLVESFTAQNLIPERGKAPQKQKAYAGRFKLVSHSIFKL
jgi:hypothetical protein